MGIFTPGEWEFCGGMTKGEGCKAPPGRHRSHKKSFGRWYGEIPPKPTRDREKAAKKKKR